MAPKSHEKLSKMEPGGAQGRFILHFYAFRAMSKKSDFSRSSQEAEKKKIRAMWRYRVDFVAASDRQVVHFWPGGSQGPPRARGLVKKKRQRSRRAAGARSDTPWADGPVNVYLFIYLYNICIIFIYLFI